MRNLLLALLLVAPVTGAFATSVSADELYDKCMKAADGTNVAFGTCGSEWVERADAKLNATWKDLYSSDLEETSKKDLLAEQRAWIAYKDKSCEFLASGDFGREGQVIEFPSCRAGVIEQRIRQLEEYTSPSE